MKLLEENLTASETDDAVVDSLRRPLPLWFLLGGLYLGLRLAKIPPEFNSLVGKALLSAGILSVSFGAANLAPLLLRVGGPQRNVTITPAPVTGVVRQVVKIAVLAVGALVLLSTLGISITPVLTTVGIGGIAVALGLRETLSNLFAGMQVTVAGNIGVGDFIKLESGEEGYVEDIQWRTTRIRTLPNNSVLIPNSRLAQSVVTNYHRPSKDIAILIDVGVHYSSDLSHVESVTRDVARQITKTIPGSVPQFDPFIRYPTFADSSINFTVILRAREFTDGFLIKHEFIKALSLAYTSEGIVIPLPIRAINIEQERANDAELG